MLSVILVNWNGWADTLACVQSLLNARLDRMRIIVVDNLSPNCSMEAFSAWAEHRLDILPTSSPLDHLSRNSEEVPRQVAFGRYFAGQKSFEFFGEASAPPHGMAQIFIVSSGYNGGFGHGCNVGMTLADQLGTDAYWLLNNDCVVASETPAAVLATALAHPEKVWGTVVRYYDDPQKVQTYGGGYFFPRTGMSINLTSRTSTRPLDWIYGASLIISQKVRKSVGDFDEAIFMYYEETDYCIRVSKAGFSMDVIDVDVFHRHGASLGGQSVFAWHHVYVNKWYVLRKQFGWGAWVAVHLGTLLLRCVVPLGESNRKRGARQALRQLICGSAS